MCPGWTVYLPTAVGGLTRQSDSIIMAVIINRAMIIHVARIGPCQDSFPANGTTSMQNLKT